MSEPTLAHRAQVAVAVRRGDAEGERVARQNLAEAKVAKAINAAINAAPPLTTEARERLASLLQNGGA